MTGWTEKPWSISEARGSDDEYWIVGGEGQDWGLIAEVGLKEDADLVAAAPDLAEALENVLDSLGALTNRDELLGWMSQENADKVFAALAKARGTDTKGDAS